MAPGCDRVSEEFTLSTASNEVKRSEKVGLNVVAKAPDGKICVEAAVEALACLAGNVLVQVLAVHTKHRCHPPRRLFSETGPNYISSRRS